MTGLNLIERAKNAVERIEFLSKWWNVALVLAVISGFLVGTMWANLVWLFK